VLLLTLFLMLLLALLLTPINSFDYPVNQTTFYDVMRDAGYWTMTTGKDDLTKHTQLGSRNPGCIRIPAAVMLPSYPCCSLLK